MNRFARKVIHQAKSLGRPPRSVEITVETTHGAGLHYGGEPSTGVKYEIYTRDGRKICSTLTFFDGGDETSERKGISTAKTIAAVVSQNYNPRGYKQKSIEQTMRFDTWPLTERIYSTGFYCLSPGEAKINAKFNSSEGAKKIKPS